MINTPSLRQEAVHLAEQERLQQPRVGANPMSTGGWMEELNVVHSHDGIFCLQREEISDSCYDMDEP